MKASFSRKAPTEFPGSSGVPLGWMAISYRWFADKQKRRRIHGKWYRLTSTHGTTFRVLRMSGSLKGTANTAAGEIVIDWPAWLKLHGFSENTDEPLELEIARAGCLDLPRIALSHPDPMVKLSMQLGLLSLGLGVLSIILVLL